MWYGMFDWEHTKEKLLGDPFLYRIGLKNKCFNQLVFCRWYCDAIWQSAVVLFVTFRTFSESNGSSAKGNMDSLYLEGAFLIETMIILVNFKIFV